MSTESKALEYLEWDFTYDFSYLDPPLQRSADVNISGEGKMKSWVSSTVKGPQAITLHWTATYSLATAVNVLRMRGVGYHFIIDLNGTIVQTLSVNRRAHHAGTSWGPKGNTWTPNGSLNDYSIGISFVFHPAGQYAKYFEHAENTVQKINSKQLKAVGELIAALKFYYPSLKWVTDHFNIVPWNKGDIYYFALPGTNGSSPLGHYYVEQIKADNQQKLANAGELKWWSCGSDWYDKSGAQIPLSKNPTLFPTGSEGGGKWKLTSDGVSRYEDKTGSYKPYSKEYKAKQVLQWQKDWKDGRVLNFGTHDMNMTVAENTDTK